MNTNEMIKQLRAWGEVIDEIQTERNRLEEKGMMTPESMTEADKAQLKLLRHLSKLMYI